MSANAPFCNGTHRDVVRFHAMSHRGFWEILGVMGYMASFGIVLWNYYT